MKKNNPGSLTAPQQARKEYQKKKRVRRQAKFQAALDKRVKLLVKEILRLKQLVKQNEVETKRNESKV